MQNHLNVIISKMLYELKLVVNLKKAGSTVMVLLVAFYRKKQPVYKREKK